MDERAFETELERMFAQPPVFRDSDAFAQRVAGRLNRAWRMRAVGIAVAGTVGGLIAISQTIGSGLGLRMRDAQVQSNRSLETAYDTAVTQLASFGGGDLAGLDLGANVFWMVAAAFVLVAGAIATRVFDEA